MQTDLDLPLTGTKPGAVDTRRPEPADTLMHLSPDQCQLSSHNARDYAALTYDSCADLITAIELAGVIEPILVRQLPDGRYEILCGARRHWAVSWLHANGRHDIMLPAIVRDGPDQTAFVVAELENRGRAELSALERGRAYATALQTHYDSKKGALAKAIGLRPATITNLVALAGWPDTILAAYPSPHAILEVDAQRLVPLVQRHRAAVEKEAAVIAREQARRRDDGIDLLGRAAVTARLVRAASDGRSRTPLAIVNAKGEPLLTLRGRAGEALAILVHRTGERDLPDLAAALQLLVTEHRQGRRGTFRLREPEATAA